MIKAYIYGTPKGFDAYGSVKSFEGYLKGFYISTRQGSRMMVNRRPNGETIYSYLHYDLMEYSDILDNVSTNEHKAGRPNSFFGMSLHIGDGLYTPDFKLIFGWFEHLFKKILEDETILKKTPSGIIQYQVSRFASAPYIETLYENLPQIFSDKSEAKLIPYDESFFEGKSGQIAQLKKDEDESTIISAFKQYQWIALSSSFKKIYVTPGTGIGIELDFNDLNERLATFNKVILPIAVNPDASSYDKLRIAKDLVQEDYSDIKIYKDSIQKQKGYDDEYKKFTLLANEYVSLYQNITELLTKFESEAAKNNDVVVNVDDNDGNKYQKQYCHSCKEYKDVSEFSSLEATKCIACENNSKKSTKKTKGRECPQCGEIKLESEFGTGKVICKSCEARKLRIASIKRWSKIASLAILLVVCVGGAILLKPKIESYFDDNKNVDNEITDNTVNKTDFESCISDFKYQEAFDLLSDKLDRNDYLPFDDTIVNQVWEIINGSTNNLDEGINNLNSLQKGLLGTNGNHDIAGVECRENVEAIIKNHSDLLSWLDLDDNDFGPKTYKRINSTIFYNSKYSEEWKNIVDNKYKRYQESKNRDKDSDTSANDKDITIWVYNLDKDYINIGKPQQYNIGGGNNQIELTVRPNTFVTICYNDGISIHNSDRDMEIAPNPIDGSKKKEKRMKNEYRVKPKKKNATGEYEFNIKKDNKIIATINIDWKIPKL